MKKARIEPGNAEDSLVINEDFSFSLEDNQVRKVPQKKEKVNNFLTKKNLLDEIISKKKLVLEFSDSSEEEDNLEDNYKKDGVDLAEDAVNSEYFEHFDKDSFSERSFAEMNLSRPLMKGITSLKFVHPTKIQAAAIPIALQGKDICGGAVTGSGKTAAFMIPIIERLTFRSKSTPLIRVLVLLPTRELAVQCHEVATKLSAFTDVKVSLAAGGLPMKQQEIELRKRPDIVVATPGRLIDHIRNSPSFTLDHIEILVLDEADRMLEDGFKDELDEIIRFCPKGRQTMLFSATMTDSIDELIRLSLNHPVRLHVDSSSAIVSKLSQEFIRIRENKESDRIPVLLAICKRTFKSKCIVFVPEKIMAHRICIIFGLNGLKAAELHGNLTQMQRLDSLERFKRNEVDFLLATDLAARGIDIEGVETVINYSMPNDYRQYQHRVGRTARAGKSGKSVTLIGEVDRKILKLAVKNSAASVKQRLLQPEVVSKYRSRVEELEEKVQEILREEKEEKLLQKAEMEAAKATNMVMHKDEIYARPAKTWFQTSKDKLKSRKRSKNNK